MTFHRFFRVSSVAERLMGRESPNEWKQPCTRQLAANLRYPGGKMAVFTPDLFPGSLLCEHTSDRGGAAPRPCGSDDPKTQGRTQPHRHRARHCHVQYG